jgi:outer membrane lipoprotein LolB
MFRNYTSRLAVCLLCLIVASCATVKEQVVTEPAGWVAEQQIRQQITAWEIRGRLGVQTESNGGTLDIIWKQSDDDYSIRLIAPLGAGTYLVQGDTGFAEIRFPDGEKKIVNNVNDVFASTLEVDLPVSALKDWIRGLPAKTLSVEEINWNEQGLLYKIKQSGWNIEMKKYSGKKILLPHVIFLSRDDNVELDIRLLLRQWLVDN